MINWKCFTKEWLTEQKESLGCRNPILLEKAVMALELVGRLQEAQIPFQFKGGTSLLLRLPTVKRLSIDVDIVCLTTQAQLEATLRVIASQAPFTRYEHNPKRDKEMPPKRHYWLYFRSAIENKETHILLDVLLEPDLTVPGDEVIIQTAFIEVERQVKVNVPTIETLLGDKLTAFAPTTVGILYHPNRKLDIVKQLYDVATLFDAAVDLLPVASAYNLTVAKQNSYRNTSHTLEATLSDAVAAAYSLTEYGLRGAKENGNTTALFQGIRALESHLLKEPFRHEHARIACGKVALLAALLRQANKAVHFTAYRYEASDAAALGTAILANTWAPLQKLRGANTEAFYYWWKAQALV